MRPGRSHARPKRRGTDVGAVQPVECPVCLGVIPPASQARAPRVRGQLVHPRCAPGGDDE